SITLLCSTHLHLICLLMLPRPPRSTLFPTRRSSDLQIIKHKRLRRTLVPRQVKLHAIDDHPTRCNDGCRHLLGFLNFVSKPKLQDRKSTRLNSSHVKISYAVFCLKKKKTRTRTTNKN